MRGIRRNILAHFLGNLWGAATGPPLHGVLPVKPGSRHKPVLWGTPIRFSRPRTLRFP
ncbi:hypothetical protein ACJU26_08840 [Acidithiobacillus sp. M4-SHS-6]|uniref:hypothetical protein n=1 Tax=Acidithiobacillus sp. M4-SHS-6 TaxID=3383024 RepID=UPI0039BE2112